MPTALIAEDEPLLAEALQRLLAQAWPELEVLELARDGDAALERILALRPDVAFLDIRMPGRNGLEVAQALAAGAAVLPELVFVTAYDQYALAAFDAAAADYLLKPVAAPRLARCVERLKARLAAPAQARADQALETLRTLLAGLPQQQAAPSPPSPSAPPLRFLRVGVGDVIRQVPVDEILYLEAQDKYVSVVTAAGSALVRTALAELAAALDPQRFVRIHRSTVVNLDAVESIRRDFAGRTWVHLRAAPGQERAPRLAVSRQFAGQFRAM